MWRPGRTISTTKEDAMSHARSLGRAAGRQFLAPSLNPFPDGSAESLEWEDEWRRATGEELLLRDQERRCLAGFAAAEACTEIGA